MSLKERNFSSFFALVYKTKTHRTHVL